MTETDPTPATGSGDPGAATFDAASELVVDYLTRTVPMGLWAVTRMADDRQVMLTVQSPGYPVEVGTELPRLTSLCQQMATGAAPSIAADTSEVPEYRVAVADAERLGFQVGAYAGVPILGPTGELFGTLCGYNSTAAPDLTSAVEPLLTVFASLLSNVLAADRALTDARRDRERARDLAEVDELTGLLNRRGWDRFLHIEEARFRRFGDPAVVIVLDVDDFKAVNDAHGHHAGDRLLRSAAHIIRTTARATDVVARLGGDEFGVLATSAGRTEAETLIRRLEHNLAESGLRVSAGCAPHTVSGGFARAWEEADSAMYSSKRRRRGEREPERRGDF